jgi:cytidylate kinase
MGSLGRDVALAAAERLGYRMVWRDLINQAARRSGAPEAALMEVDELGLLGLRLSASAGKAYREAVQSVMLELAAEGDVVIVGRAGQAILRGRPGVLHVRVIAPPDVRARRVAEADGISIEAAAARISASDEHRRRYLRRFYRVRWDDPDLYDLVINTARISVPAAAELICLALSRSTAPEPDEISPATGPQS